MDAIKRVKGPQVRLAVIGVGGMGSYHCSVISPKVPEARLVAVCDIAPATAKAEPDRWVEAWFADAGKLKTRAVNGTTLKPGSEVSGPAIIEEPTTTIVIPPGISGRLTAAGNYIFDIGGSNV